MKTVSICAVCRKSFCTCVSVRCVWCVCPAVLVEHRGKASGVFSFYHRFQRLNSAPQACPCPNSLSVAVISITIEASLERKGFIRLTFPDDSQSLREAKAETQARRGNLTNLWVPNSFSGPKLQSPIIVPQNNMAASIMTLLHSCFKDWTTWLPVAVINTIQKQLGEWSVYLAFMLWSWSTLEGSQQRSSNRATVEEQRLLPQFPRLH